MQEAKIVTDGRFVRPKPDYTLKWIVVGEPYCGKSSILDRVADGKFHPQREPTVGIEFQTLRGVGAVAEEDYHYKIILWDCAGQQRFRSIVRGYFRQSHLVFVVYDVTNRASFQRCQEWIAAVREEADEDNPLVFMLVGNKCDLAASISESEAQTAAKLWGCQESLRTSAMTGHNLPVLLDRALSHVHTLIVSGKLRLQQVSGGRVVQFDDEEEEQEKASCYRCF